MDTSIRSQVDVEWPGEASEGGATAEISLSGAFATAKPLRFTYPSANLREARALADVLVYSVLQRLEEALASGEVLLRRCRLGDSGAEIVLWIDLEEEQLELVAPAEGEDAVAAKAAALDALRRLVNDVGARAMSRAQRALELGLRPRDGQPLLLRRTLAKLPK